MNEFVVKYNLTDDEVSLLKLAFKLVDTVVEYQRYDRYDNETSNNLFHLKEKLGIYELLEE